MLYFNFQRDVTDTEQMFRQIRGGPVFQFSAAPQIGLTMGVNIDKKSAKNIFVFTSDFSAQHTVYLYHTYFRRAES